MTVPTPDERCEEAELQRQLNQSEIDRLDNLAQYRWNTISSVARGLGVDDTQDDGLDQRVIDAAYELNHHRLQIEMAASGCISGTLSEWPHLNAALTRLGFDLPLDTRAIELTRICKSILRRSDEKSLPHR